jgi:hypothetical protein
MQLGGDDSEITRVVSLASVAVQSTWQIPGSTLGGGGAKKTVNNGLPSGQH